jgi:hypothetical protein
MPKLACWSCGRQIYTVAPLESLFAEERRCPRCGAFLRSERREAERRVTNRRTNPPDDPGPPATGLTGEAAVEAVDEPTDKPALQAKTKAKGTPEEAERRKADRRTDRRRGSLAPPPPTHDENEPFGWRD